MRIGANAFNQQNSIKQRIYKNLLSGKKGGRLSWKNISAKEYITNEKQATQRDAGR